MLDYIEFKDKRFKTKEDYNVMAPLTMNTIVVCNNAKMMNYLADEIVNTVNGNAEHNDYSCDNEDIGKAKQIVRFCGLYRIIDINGQRITLALEPAMIYKAENIGDIWFYDWIGEDENYKESIYPLTIFKGSHEKWEMGKDEVYKMVCGGRYGAYDGNWVKLEV